MTKPRSTRCSSQQRSQPRCRSRSRPNLQPHFLQNRKEKVFSKSMSAIYHRQTSSIRASNVIHLRSPQFRARKTTTIFNKCGHGIKKTSKAANRRPNHERQIAARIKQQMVGQLRGPDPAKLLIYAGVPLRQEGGKDVGMGWKLKDLKGFQL